MPPSNNQASPPQSANPKDQIVQRLGQANNVLVTVSNNPTVDQLSACIGLTLLLNKLGKHGTAVFSGQIPSTIEFLKPEQTIEKNTDSLRDFIIALDKSKADKLRYKVEDRVVKIFITPYRTTITDKDLEFSQGDFNVDVVVALGVHKQQDLDQAITAHGRILHDATVVSVNTAPNGELGSINWVKQDSSSLCELVVEIGEALGGPNVFDAQMATAFLTGIVAETNRFSNAKATPATMAMTGRLMTAGASTQLIAKELEPPKSPPAPPKSPPPPPPKPKNEPAIKPIAKATNDVPPKKDDGEIEINHEGKKPDLPPAPFAPPAEGETDLEHIHIDNDGNLRNLDDISPVVEAKKEVKAEEKTAEQTEDNRPPTSLVTEPPTLGGTLTANTKPEGLSPTTDPLSLPDLDGPLLTHREDKADSSEQTLDTIEKTVGSPHPTETSQLNSARDAVNQAIAGHQPLEPIEALNAQPVDLNLGHSEPPQPLPKPAGYMDLPPNLVPPASPITDPSAPQDQEDKPSGGPPPPVPPPLMPPVL